MRSAAATVSRKAMARLAGGVAVIALAAGMTALSPLSASGRGMSSAPDRANRGEAGCIHEGAGRGGYDIDRRIEHLRVLLDLDDTQVDRIRSLLEKERAELDSIRAEGRGERREMRAERRRMLADRRREADRRRRMRAEDGCDRVEREAGRAARRAGRERARAGEEARRAHEISAIRIEILEKTRSSIAGLLDKDQKEKFEVLCEMRSPMARHGAPRGGRGAI